MNLRRRRPVAGLRAVALAGLAALLCLGGGPVRACDDPESCSKKKGARPAPPAAPAPAPPADRGPGAGGPAEACPLGQTIVLLRPGVDPDEAAAAFARRYEGTVCRVYRFGVRGVTLRCAGPRVSAMLEADPLVASVEPDVRVQMYAQEVPSGVRRVGAVEGWKVGAGKDARVDVGVAVLDTGVDLSHPDLAIAGSASFVEGVATALDGQGHGTHCAGIVAARDDGEGVVGIAPGAKLYAIKVLDDSGGGALSDVIAGLDWVARNSDKIAVANLSLGVKGRSKSLRAAIQAVVRKGVVVVAAAGNESSDVFGEDGVFDTEDDSIPAAYPEVCAVSAMADSDGRPGGGGAEMRAGIDDTFARFSNYARRGHESPYVRSPGGAIDLAAPGVDILSTWKDGAYKRVSGTSMAAPHVAGLVARWVAARGRDSNEDGKVDELDVWTAREALIGRAEGQAGWRADGATLDPDGLREPLASSGRVPPRAAPRPPPEQIASPPAPSPSPARPAPTRPPAASVPDGVPGVAVIALIAPADPLRRGESSGIMVGVKNKNPHAVSFDLVLLDARTGEGIGRRRVDGLAGGGHRGVVFPCSGETFDPRRELRAVVLALQ